jgi:HSP20 family protein
MIFRFEDFGDAFQLLDEFRREANRLYEGGALARGQGGRAWSGLRLEDEGDAFRLTADLPGVKASDIDVTLENQTLTLTVERRVQAPEGYAVHRQERAPFRVSRSVALPARVDAEKVKAKLENGVLTLTLEKTPESKPRKINVAKA